MDLLKEKILSEGHVREGNILKVDRFLNHQLDIRLLNELGKEFHRRFSHLPVDKILTAEVSGIAIAAIAAQYFQVPVVFAKKLESKNLDPDTYEGEVYSYTKGKTYKIRVSKQYLSPGENILVLDDFLANGEAMKGLIEIIQGAKAHFIGAGVVIEKGFQNGGRELRDQGHLVESLVIIDSLENNEITFR
ncbi:xanthine phosphoribosyltransferase [Isachenkonia alkalipeptolytica]|uniref:Xanthine phosphoribosyltransferase n=1 Tax=Isachenkonia alkalipeptolytica TaxID=2565777 RepID=A0AA43XMH7_9CLOT|nr:xanthine phosphoribosyltransferase [Isachenkonia alkalipeptolytica]NBG89558.1 xanthine phosphoribosyltransferase [Isachenkonia alkalipeptolytica]